MDATPRNGARFVWLTRRRLLARRLTARCWPRDVVERSGLAREPDAG
ncbi:MAG: hypothetical protein U1F11_10260 [Steroidobacteraceae bacterium]